MDLRTETGCERDEIVIRCRTRGERTEYLENAIRGLLRSETVLTLVRGGEEYYIPVSEILFFETDGGHVAAHTADGMYGSALKLFELESALPYSFMRASKSCILNTAAVFSVKKNLAGPSEVSFRGSKKKAYISRSCFKALTERINRIRR